MEFRILGPVDVVRHGRSVALPRRKHRTLLAALLCMANTPVNPDVLVDTLWGATPPATARTNLRGHVHQLRQALGDADRVVHSRHGYLLHVADDELDAHRFERVAAALDANHTPSPEAVRRLQNALALWRGPALSDIDRSPLLQVEANRLEELRLVATERRIEADLAAGDHLSVIPELHALAAAHPYRESLHAHLVVALYRANRQADALAHYRRLRQALHDELGVDPCPRLRELEVSILNKDPDLHRDQPSPTTQVTVRSVPSLRPVQQPAAPAHLVGRTVAQRRLEEAATRPAAMIMIDGMSGVGKSALAIHTAHRLTGRFTDGVLYRDLNGASRPMTGVLHGFLRALGVDEAVLPASVEDAAALFRSVVHSRQVLILLDNADEADLDPLLPGAGPSVVVATSRQVQPGRPGTVRVALEPLAPEESVSLLAARVGPRITEDPPAAARIADLCGHLPAALQAAAGRLDARPRWPLSYMVDRLSDVDGRLDELAMVGFDLRAGIRASHRSLARSRSAIDRRAAAALTILAQAGAVQFVTTQARLLLAGDHRVEPIVERLVDMNLLTSPAPGRYRMHELVWLYARDSRSELSTSRTLVSA